MDKDFIISTLSTTFTNGVTECPICGKKFYVAANMRKQYNYRKNNKNNRPRFACSYKCFGKMKDVIACSFKIK